MRPRRSSTPRAKIPGLAAPRSCRLDARVLVDDHRVGVEAAVWGHRAPSPIVAVGRKIVPQILEDLIRKDVAAAVINAGAFAVLGQTQSSPDEIAANIKWMREKGGGKPQDLDEILRLCDSMVGKTVCVFADGAAMPTASFVTK